MAKLICKCLYKEECEVTCPRCGKKDSFLFEQNGKCSCGWSMAATPTNDFCMYGANVTKWQYFVRKEKEGCFITSAVCKILKKSDDCVELTAFRNFRDTFMQETAEMQIEVKEYYNIAPKICNAIDCLGKELTLKEYTQIWEHSLYPAFMALEIGDKQKAYNIYKNMVLGLKKQYLKDEIE